MNRLKYHYNPETCQYERVRMRWHQVITYTFGLLIMATTFLTGMLVLHNTIVETDRERELRAENKALKEHKNILEKEFSEIESTLASLQQQDQQLYEKLFNSSPQKAIAKTSSSSKENLLLADASTFRSLLDILGTQTSQMINASQSSNEGFSKRLEIEKKNLERIASIPSLPPVSDFNLEKLISGFGKRINPFHKGIYDHPGIDFASARGTTVLATADGKVIEVKRSNLQAGYGNYIEIDHGQGITTRYAHLEDIYVKVGQKISKRMVIGSVGNSGGSIAPHVHYEVVRDGQPVDAILYIIEGLTGKEHGLLVERGKQLNQSLD